MTVAPSSNRVSRQALIDLMVALVAVPLLVVFGLMLESNMRGEWTDDAETRWHVLGLGLALLFISLLVMGYVTHRLGICIWQASQTDDVLSGSRRSHRNNGTRFNGESQLHLVVSGELPPSYESVVSFEMPPPYCSILVFDDKGASGVDLQQKLSSEAKQCESSAQQPKQLGTSSKQFQSSGEETQLSKQCQTSAQQPKQSQLSSSSASSVETSLKDTTG